MSDEPHQSFSVPSCDKEPIHIINRIQPCGYLIVVNSHLTIVQVSSNSAELHPSTTSKVANGALEATEQEKKSQLAQQKILDSIIGKHLSFLFEAAAVDQVRSVIETIETSTSESEATKNFLIRSSGTFVESQVSCSVIQSGEFFLLEIENNEASPDMEDTNKNRNAMMFMENMAKGLRKCWSIEEMSSLVCSKIMVETPYDRGMVYRFDHDGSGEVVYETFREDAKTVCTKDSFLGLRFPATDIPRQARDLFMRNTLRFVYDVNGKDHQLYPSKVQSSMGLQYIDLSMCRLRGSSYIHLDYLKNMKVTSSMVIAIIVNKQLWGLYSFHGYREPLVPSIKTRFLCEMASVMSSMIMESHIRMADHNRLMEIDQTICHLRKTSLMEFLEDYQGQLKALLDVNLIAMRLKDSSSICSFGPSDVNITDEIFDSLIDTYGSVCKDYGIVFIDEQKTNSVLNKMNLHTVAFHHLPGVDILLSRQATVERVEWGGDPNKKLEPDGTLTPRNSFAAYVKDHRKKGKPWNEVDKQMVNRFVDQVENCRSKELCKENNQTIQALREEKKQAISDAKVNLDFFAHMAHELRTPFHGILGSLEAMREDPNLANNELLNTAEMCGKNMIKILDDILLVAKGSYSLILEEQAVDVEEFLRQNLGDMMSYAHMEGVSIRVRKQDVICKHVLGDFNRIRQVINNLISNAIKFSDHDIYVELLQRQTFSQVVSVWRTYQSMYPNCEPCLAQFSSSNKKNDESGENELWTVFSIIDKGIGISGPDLKRLGVAFTQLSSGRQKKYQGTGLGISICNMLVSALHGQLVIFSGIDFGSCFTFAIPTKRQTNRKGKKESLAKKDDVADKETRVQRLLAQFENLGLKEETYLKILVVDDSSINRKLCSRKIKRWLPSITISECSNGKDAIEEYEYDGKNIMGIFLDYHMHGMDGDECTRRIREYERMKDTIKHVYIAGYTADVLDDSTEMLLKAGMDCVIPKPEPPQAFENVLKSMMESFHDAKGVR